jgi:hypothetical protein
VGREVGRLLGWGADRQAEEVAAYARWVEVNRPGRATIGA